MPNNNAKAEIKTIDELLKMELTIPNYQRPYKWTSKNVADLLNDIDMAIEESKKHGDTYKYRIGTIILHNKKDGTFDIVDGQQRLITLSLIKRVIDSSFENSLLTYEFADDDSKSNIYNNYKSIEERLRTNTRKQEYADVFENILETVRLTVEDISEAFQLFDSQNTRGKELDPHDLLKAYHLREMNDDHSFEKMNLVKRWEAVKPSEISNLFSNYLYRILNWSKKEKTKNFTAQDIYEYKGVNSKCNYTYARRIRKSMPYFQIDQSFSAGADFFLMVEHYITMLSSLKNEIKQNKSFDRINKVLALKKNEQYSNRGFGYAVNLFFCALLFYYDRFHLLDVVTVEKLFVWSMMIRVDMIHLGFDTINNYAIGDQGKDRHTNHIAMFHRIATARDNSEITNIIVKIPDSPRSYGKLHESLKELMENMK